MFFVISGAMTDNRRCKYRAEFCYVCAVPWKQCSCAHWDEERLLLRAEEIVDRDAPAQLGAAEIDHRVHIMQQDLRENHECQHEMRFQRINADHRQRFTCDMCEETYYLFILRCPQCHIQICVDCRRNRLR